MISCITVKLETGVDQLTVGVHGMHQWSRSLRVHSLHPPGLMFGSLTTPTTTHVECLTTSTRTHVGMS